MLCYPVDFLATCLEYVLCSIFSLALLEIVDCHKTILCSYLILGLFSDGLYCMFSDRFLPDKAIDLIDEAGSRVRLRHAQVMIFIFCLFV